MLFTCSRGGVGAGVNGPACRAAFRRVGNAACWTSSMKGCGMGAVQSLGEGMSDRLRIGKLDHGVDLAVRSSYNRLLRHSGFAQNRNTFLPRGLG